MFGLLKKYINKRIELIKIEFMEASSSLLGIMLFFIILLMAGLMFFFMFSLAIGMIIGNLLNNYGIGILIFSLVYLLTFIIMLLCQKRIKRYLMNKIIEFQLNHERAKENREYDDENQ